MGWLVSVIAAPVAPGNVAWSWFGPRARPVTRPSKRPSERTAKALVTSFPPTVTLASRGFEPEGRATATSADPPLTRSARPDKTEIESCRLAAGLLAASAGPASTDASSATATTTLTVTPHRFTPWRIAHPSRVCAGSRRVPRRFYRSAATGGVAAARARVAGARALHHASALVAGRAEL